MKNLHLFSCLLILMLAACQPQTETIDFKDLEDFFSGEWTFVNEDVLMTESWAPAGDAHLQGITLASRNRDTLFYETLSIVQTDTGIYYIARVKGENNGNAIAFRLETLNSDSVVFTKPLHDFPQRIVYCKTAPDRMEAILTGQGHSGPRTIRLRFSGSTSVAEGQQKTH